MATLLKRIFQVSMTLFNNFLLIYVHSNILIAISVLLPCSLKQVASLFKNICFISTLRYDIDILGCFYAIIFWVTFPNRWQPYYLHFSLLYYICTVVNKKLQNLDNLVKQKLQLVYLRQDDALTLILGITLPYLTLFCLKRLLDFFLFCYLFLITFHISGNFLKF